MELQSGVKMQDLQLNLPSAEGVNNTKTFCWLFHLLVSY